VEVVQRTTTYPSRRLFLEFSGWIHHRVEMVSLFCASCPIFDRDLHIWSKMNRIVKFSTLPVQMIHVLESLEPAGNENGMGIYRD